MEGLFTESKRDKRQGMEDRLGEIQELETGLNSLIEENIELRRAGEERMRK